MTTGSKTVISRSVSWLLVVLLFAGSLWPLWRVSFPPVATPLTVDVVFPVGIPGQCDPILTTGAQEDGDFLAVRYVDARTAVLLYDVWGVGGPTSRPFSFRPGERRTLVITMPTLNPVSELRSHERRPLRVTLDGEVLLENAVYFHRRTPQQLYLAINPIGGSLVRDAFSGRLARTDGHVLRGGPECLFSVPQRLVWMVRTHVLGILWRALASLVAGLVLARLLTRVLISMLQPEQADGRVPVFRGETHTRAPHRWFLATAGVCTFAFAAVITGGTFRFFEPEPFTELYDVQATSLLHGRLDLPASARNGESFIFEGRTYMYFGPTPALLRLPFAALGIGGGKLSRACMVAYYVALLAAAYAVLVYATRLARGHRAWPAPCHVVLLVASAGMGSTLFFLSSRAYVYHEAILCGAMFALWSACGSLRFIAAPATNAWMGAALCGLLSVHARPSSGLFALAMLGVAALVVAGRLWLQARPRGIPVVLASLQKPALAAAAAVAGVLSFNGLSYLKFKSFEGAPLRYHVQYQEGRLDRIKGSNFHLVNLPLGLESYVWGPNFEFRRTFPYFYLLGLNADRYPKARMDMTEPLAAMPYTMPSLVLLALVGGAWAFAAWPQARAALAVITFGAAPMTLALLAAVAVSERYTGDFCPALILAAAFGLQGLELLPPSVRRIALALVGLLAAVSILLNLAITLHYQGDMVWGVSDDVQARYQGLRKIVDGLLGLGANE